MQEHLEHLFGGYLEGYHDGRIELSWSESEPDAKGKYALRFAETFATDDFDALINKAIAVNSHPRTNVYIGAALRKPDTPQFGRCDHSNFYVATAFWDDLDDKDANDRAHKSFAGAPPSLVVRTGEFPHWRHQLWWRLTEPLTDFERVRAGVSGIVAATGGDGQVADPVRVMRLAGSIAWDQKEGRRPEITRIIKLKTPGLAAYQAEHVERAFPPLFTLAHIKTARNQPGPNLGVVRKKNSLGLDTNIVTDGRERHMLELTCARLIDYCGQFGSVPTSDELFEHSWSIYERTTDFSRPGRDKPEFMKKCHYTIQRFETGKIRGIRSLDDAIACYKVRREARQQNTRHEAAEGTPEDGVKTDAFEFLDIPAIKALPDARWVVQDIIPEDGLGFIYGPSGHGKTFVALHLALSIAYGHAEWWWGKKVKRHGLVVYIAREGVAGLKNRIEAWQRELGVEHDNVAFALVRAGMNFMSEDDVGRLLRTIDAAAAALNAKPTLIFVDTVSRVMPGADENLQKEMTIFVAACDALRDRFKATVVGVHHAGKSGDMRGSTVLKGAGDFVFKVERTDEADPRSSIGFHAEKIKDSEDGWTKLIELKAVEWMADGEIDAERKSLVAVPVADDKQPAKQGKGWPDKAKCNRILAAIEQAWLSGRPWSHAPQSPDRYAPLIMVEQFEMKVKTAQELIKKWLANDVLVISIRDTDSKLKGLKVLSYLD